MIIVSQNKEVLFPFTRGIYLNSFGDVIGEVGEADDYFLLGKYKSKERAKEVLQDIIEDYQHKYDVYPMPKE